MKKIDEEKLIANFTGRHLTGKEKEQYRKTNKWKQLRQKYFVKEIKHQKNGKLKIIPNIDVITGRKLKKNFNLHHLSNIDYTTEELLIPLNFQTHKILHLVYSEMCKNKEFLNKLIYYVNYMGELNNWKDF